MAMTSLESGAPHPYGHHVPVVFGRLREMILNGTIPAGKVTSQQELAEMVEASRSPVREALRMLENEGLVVHVANRRVQIAGLSLDEVEGLQATRITLECAAARLTIPQLTREDLAEIGGLIAQMEDYLSDKDFVRHEGPHRAFHLKLVTGGTATENRMLSVLYDHMTRYRRIAARIEGYEYQARLADHRAIADGARCRDADAVALLLTVHYLHTGVEVATELDPGYDITRLLTTAELAAPGAVEAFELGRGRAELQPTSKA